VWAFELYWQLIRVQQRMFSNNTYTLRLDKRYTEIVSCMNKLHCADKLVIPPLWDDAFCNYHPLVEMSFEFDVNSWNIAHACRFSVASDKNGFNIQMGMWAGLCWHGAASAVMLCCGGSCTAVSSEFVSLIIHIVQYTNAATVPIGSCIAPT
jgi:hypothetical protein